ncbi:hypothetical protein KXQ82_11630 [Mucilaginibacter sp. HMF5004]|uniref:hypothetical protein n=1 Tax=Mucilaginibacter rivuli TaxID=2857527 RepID=UPI001C5E54BE|nr:hypothetical protein [Mucilaginibacter rivuli]MBW4890375.1 hypothetical protein [Mucilaginibacter rivuli]
MDNLLLKIITWFYPFLERTGVDTYQLNHILRVKLMIDNRRPKAMLGNKKGAATASTKTGGTSWAVIFVTLLMGSFYGIVLFIFDSPMVGQAVYFMLFMLLMSLVLITDFTSVLIDVRDQYIILPRPVSDRTASMARILHITIYVMKLAFMQGLPAMVMIGFIDGIAAVPLFFFQIIEATLFSIFLVNIVYLLLMRSVSPQRVKDIISYFQIGFSIIIFSIFRMPRLFDFVTNMHFDLLSHKWTYLVPSVWIACLNETLIHASRASYLTAILAFAGIMLPVVSTWFVVTVLAPGFNRSLAIIAMSDGASLPSSKAKEVKKPGILSRIANIVARDPVENAGFRITWKLAARTREFKMKVYPSFAYWPVYVVYMAFTTKGDNFFEGLQNSRMYIFLLYISVFIISTVLQHVTYSEKYKASWIYYTTPVNEPGKILSGMFKAAITFYFVPYFIIISILLLTVWGPGVINDMILAFFLNQIFGMLQALFMIKGLPFSKPLLTKKAGGKGLLSLFILGLAGGVGYAHYVLARWEIVIWVLAAMAFALNWVMYRYYRRQGWDSMDSAEID